MIITTCRASIALAKVFGLLVRLPIQLSAQCLIGKGVDIRNCAAERPCPSPEGRFDGLSDDVIDVVEEEVSRVDGEATNSLLLGFRDAFWDAGHKVEAEGRRPRPTCIET